MISFSEFLNLAIFHLPVWGYIVIALALTHITMASVTIFLHRHQAHNALTLHPIPSHFFRFWLWMTTGMVTKEWVAVHRKHHAKCETVEDPHSPQIKGIRQVLFNGAGLYRNEVKNLETLEHYGQGTPDDWFERNVYSRFPYLGLIIMGLVNLILFGWIGLIIFTIQMLWVPFWAAGVINGIGHYWGYRNFESPDSSRNISPIGILIGGEELHNNHHTYAQSARLSNKWWEFDIGWMYIRSLALLGLAKVRRIAPRIQIKKNKQMIDLDTLRAVIRDRYNILTLYGRKVVRPVIKAERKASQGSTRSLLTRARRLMARDSHTLDSYDHATLKAVLEQNQALETVYRFKTQLKSLWNHTANDGAKRLERLKQWCAEAEQSNIRALEEFARVLRSYTLKPS